MMILPVITLRHIPNPASLLNNAYVPFLINETWLSRHLRLFFIQCRVKSECRDTNLFF